jgi:hypothetical protein
LVVECCIPITLEVHNGNNGCIDRKLLVVYIETVRVSVWVREETRLEDWIDRWLKVWDGGGRRKGHLLNPCKIVNAFSFRMSWMIGQRENRYSISKIWTIYIQCRQSMKEVFQI